MKEKLDVYMNQIGRFGRISVAEENALARKFAKGDTAAREKLVNCNLKLVVKIAHDYRGRGVPLADLIAEGNIGLMKASLLFNPAKGAKFSSYASWWIKQKMRHAIVNQAHIIRIPIGSFSKMGKIYTARKRFERKNNVEPTNAEIAEATGLTERTVKGLENNFVSVFSLDEKIPFTDLTYMEKAEEKPAEQVDTELIDRMAELLESDDKLLTPREKAVIAMRFGLGDHEPKTLNETSESFHCTRERIRQIQNDALRKLRDRLLKSM